MERSACEDETDRERVGRAGSEEPGEFPFFIN